MNRPRVRKQGEGNVRGEYFPSLLGVTLSWRRWTAGRGIRHPRARFFQWLAGRPLTPTSSGEIVHLSLHPRATGQRHTSMLLKHIDLTAGCVHQGRSQGEDDYKLSEM